MRRRAFLKQTARSAAVAAIALRAPAVLGQAKPFAGVTIHGASFQHVFHSYLKEYIPEFEEKTGMKVDFTTQAFPVYNQRADLRFSCVLGETASPTPGDYRTDEEIRRPRPNRSAARGG